jgi:hypothetical protein
MFKTEMQFQCIGLDPRNNEGINEILRDWTHFKRRRLGIRPGYYDREGVAKLLVKHKADPEVIQYIAETMMA